MGDIVERLQDAIDAVHPNSTDEEWTHLLAESMNAADEINALRERVEQAYRAGYADGAEDQERDGFTHKDAINEGWHNFILAQQGEGDG